MGWLQNWTPQTCKHILRVWGLILMTDVGLVLYLPARSVYPILKVKNSVLRLQNLPFNDFWMFGLPFLPGCFDVYAVVLVDRSPCFFVNASLNSDDIWLSIIHVFGTTTSLPNMSCIVCHAAVIVSAFLLFMLLTLLGLHHNGMLLSHTRCQNLIYMGIYL